MMPFPNESHDNSSHGKYACSFMRGKSTQIMTKLKRSQRIIKIKFILNVVAFYIFHKCGEFIPHIVEGLFHMLWNDFSTLYGKGNMSASLN